MRAFGPKSGMRRRSWITLWAFRCPDCGFDIVRDGNDDWWVLDASDYETGGSWNAEPTLFDPERTS